jgi:alkylhydroperoxidase/carboxymuconolactone decarboxylase family protein YurZ
MTDRSHPDKPLLSVDAALERLADEPLVTADVERREALPAEMRRLMSIVALLAQQRLDAVDTALRKAVDEGISPSALLETLGVAAQHGINVPERVIEQLRAHVDRDDPDTAAT